MDMSEFNKDRSVGLRIAAGGARWLVRLALLLLFAALVLFFGRKLYSLGYETMDVSAVQEKDGTDVAFLVKQDMTFEEAAESLSDSGLIKGSTQSFVLQSYIYAGGKKLQPGVYMLNTSMTVPEILEALTAEPEEEEET